MTGTGGTSVLAGYDCSWATSAFRPGAVQTPHLASELELLQTLAQELGLILALDLMLVAAHKRVEHVGNLLKPVAALLRRSAKPHCGPQC